MHQVIVVGTDGSSTADAAVQRAATLAKLTGARVELVSGYRDNYAMAASVLSLLSRLNPGSGL